MQPVVIFTKHFSPALEYFPINPKIRCWPTFPRRIWHLPIQSPWFPKISTCQCHHFPLPRKLTSSVRRPIDPDVGFLRSLQLSGILLGKKKFRVKEKMLCKSLLKIVFKMLILIWNEWLQWCGKKLNEKPFRLEKHH